MILLYESFRWQKRRSCWANTRDLALLPLLRRPVVKQQAELQPSMEDDVPFIEVRAWEGVKILIPAAPCRPGPNPPNRRATALRLLLPGPQVTPDLYSSYPW